MSIFFRSDTDCVDFVCRFSTVAQDIIKLYMTQNNHNNFFTLNNIFLEHEIIDLLKIRRVFFGGGG